MSMKDDLHKLKFTKHKESNNIVVVILKIIMSYKKNIPNSKKVAHITRFG
jgi:hypothetical protein